MKRQWLAFYVVALVLNLVLWSVGYAQESASGPVSDPLWKVMLTMAMTSLLPPLWAAIGPVMTAWITKQVNKASLYVPRPVQVAVSALVTAALAGISGDPVAMAQAGMAGATGQVLAATNPETLRTSAPE